MAYLKGAELSGSSGASGVKAVFNQITGSFITGSLTGSLLGTATFANTSSLSYTASLALQANTASYIELSNVNGSASIATRLSTNESEIDALQLFSSSLDDTFATDLELNTVSASVKTFATDADTTLSASLATDIATNKSDISDLQSFSSSLDATFATDAELNATSASVKTFATDADTTLSASLASSISSIDPDPFPYTGNADIIGDLSITGISNVSASIAAAAQSATSATLDSVTTAGSSTNNSITIGGMQSWGDVAVGQLVYLSTTGVISAVGVEFYDNTSIGYDQGSGLEISSQTSGISLYGNTTINGTLGITGISNVSASIAAAGNSGPTPTLDSVTDAGSSTTNSITVGSLVVDMLGAVGIGNAIALGAYGGDGISINGGLNVETSTGTLQFLGNNVLNGNLTGGTIPVGNTDGTVSDSPLTFDGSNINVSSGNLIVQSGVTATSLINVGGTDISTISGVLDITAPLSITGIPDVSASIAANTTALDNKYTKGSGELLVSTGLGLIPSTLPPIGYDFEISLDEGYVVTKGNNLGDGDVPKTDDFGRLIPSNISDVGTAINLFASTNVDGTLTATTIVETSAQRYKENVKPLDSQLDNISKLNPVEFDWKKDNRHDIGFIAEEVQKVYPDLVSESSEGRIEGINYSKLTSVLIKAIQEQQEQINNLQAQINSLSVG
jgi:hypothetical protein